jgi:hypothetical protein
MMLVILISITKEGVEDYKRHNEDAKINARTVRIVLESGEVTIILVFFLYKKRKAVQRTIYINCLYFIHFHLQVTECKWRDLNVGSVLLLFGNDDVPADAVCLMCGGIQGKYMPLIFSFLSAKSN